MPWPAVIFVHGPATLTRLSTRMVPTCTCLPATALHLGHTKDALLPVAIIPGLQHLDLDA